MSGHKVELAGRIVARSQWSGPVPPPESLAAYEKVVSGAAERILALAEREAAARIEQTKADHEADCAARMKDLADYHARTTRGQFIGALVALSFMVGAVVCALYDQTAIGVTLVGATIVGLVNAIVSPRRR